eukprot:1158319-Pelagomonas_calceolata.AAC.5
MEHRHSAKPIPQCLGRSYPARAHIHTHTHLKGRSEGGRAAGTGCSTCFSQGLAFSTSPECKAHIDKLSVFRCREAASAFARAWMPTHQNVRAQVQSTCPSESLMPAYHLRKMCVRVCCGVQGSRNRLQHAPQPAASTQYAREFVEAEAGGHASVRA